MAVNGGEIMYRHGGVKVSQQSRYQKVKAE